MIQRTKEGSLLSSGQKLNGSQLVFDKLDKSKFSETLLIITIVQILRKCINFRICHRNLQPYLSDAFLKYMNIDIFCLQPLQGPGESDGRCSEEESGHQG